MLGILKTGAAYVPVDPEYPQERIDYILNNSQCDLLLTPDVYSKEDLHSCSIEDVENESSPDDIAYIIYTSGSTGKPKGVIITHESAVNTILDINQKFQVNEDDRFIGLSSICFDLSVYDIFGALSSGASIVQIKDQRDIQEVIETIDKYGITIWNSVPAIMDLTIEFIESMKEYQDNELRLVLLSGDWIPLILPEKIRKYFGKAQINSLGGATEASIWSIYYPINEINPEWKSIPYGMPLANQKFYVLNYAGQVCPVEVEGELYIGGIGLAQGYKNDDTKTKNAFIEHPTLGRLYKTGDHGVLRKEGYIEFLGRKDQQIKIRGYRVELGEVSNQLLEHKNVQQAVVIDQVDSNGKKFLCAYIVVDDEKVMGSIREYLAQKLPEYMIPQYFVKLEQLPLTPNGKIDRKVLLALEIRKNKLEEKAPKLLTRTENIIKQLIGEVLHVGDISLNESFFELGGSSIHLIQMHRKLEQLYPGKSKITDMFIYNTVSKLAKFIDKNDIEISKAQNIYTAEGKITALLTQKIRSIAHKEKVQLEDLLIAFSTYLFTKITNKMNMKVQTLLDSENVKTITLDMNNLHDFNTMFKEIYKQRKQSINIKTTNNKHLESNNFDYLMYNQTFLKGKIDPLALSNTSIEVKELNNIVHFTIKSNKERIAMHTLQELSNMFIKLIEMIISKYSIKG
ncbi:amino acid adenylation domain-containing protein [Bacillus cereus]|uniref:Amino acid adenylation domain-containing protein n=1 Tax=Bacillus cereus TaxID=1396 RepID=A0A9W7Q1J1_BACCE|nr:amino acid adenylation domain-containing protein [Bacillus cereus]